jgi:hypothetical protein
MNALYSLFGFGSNADQGIVNATDSSLDVTTTTIATTTTTTTPNDNTIQTETIVNTVNNEINGSGSTNLKDASASAPGMLTTEQTPQQEKECLNLKHILTQTLTETINDNSNNNNNNNNSSNCTLNDNVSYSLKPLSVSEVDPTLLVKPLLIRESCSESLINNVIQFEPSTSNSSQNFQSVVEELRLVLKERNLKMESVINIPVEPVKTNSVPVVENENTKNDEKRSLTKFMVPILNQTQNKQVLDKKENEKDKEIELLKSYNHELKEENIRLERNSRHNQMLLKQTKEKCERRIQQFIDAKTVMDKELRNKEKQVKSTESQLKFQKKKHRADCRDIKTSTRRLVSLNMRNVKDENEDICDYNLSESESNRKLTKKYITAFSENGLKKQQPHLHQPPKAPAPEQMKTKNQQSAWSVPPSIVTSRSLTDSDLNLTLEENDDHYGNDDTDNDNSADSNNEW